MKKLILIGTGGHTKACIDVIEEEKKYKIIGLIEKNRSRNKRFMNYPILGQDKHLVKIKKNNLNALITVGQIKNSFLREKIFNHLVTLGFIFPTIISPKAHVSKKAKIGKGSIVMHNVIINSASLIGKNCIINNRSLIEHGVEVGNHCHISTGAIINGDCKIGNNSFIGSGSVIRDGIKIGSHCIVGMGQIIKKNIKDRQTVK